MWYLFLFFMLGIHEKSYMCKKIYIETPTIYDIMLMSDTTYRRRYDNHFLLRHSVLSPFSVHLHWPQGLVTIQVNILSMYKHIQGWTSFFTPARFKSCLFFKLLLIYSKPCLVQLPKPYSFQKISWPPLDYLLWRRSGRFCQEFARVENNMDPKWK